MWAEGQGAQEIVVSGGKMEERPLAGLAINGAGCAARVRGWEPYSYGSEGFSVLDSVQELIDDRFPWQWVLRPGGYPAGP